MMSSTVPIIRCVGVAKFTVVNRHGDAKDVCVDCLPVICESHDQHDPLVVMRLLERQESQTIRW